MQVEITPDYLASQGLSPTFPERFWKKVNKDGPIPSHMPHLGQCWMWMGATDKRGRGNIATQGHHIIRHTWGSWLLHIGPIPNGMCVCHHCDNPNCVRPDHLWLGTQFQNVKDCKNKNRRAKGEMIGASKLTEVQVLEIRRRYVRRDSNNNRKLIKEFGICLDTFYNVTSRTSWKHI